jgi:hypothetical protein
MDEKVEAQQLLQDTVRKVTSTKRALGNSEREAHEHIDHMMTLIHEHLGDHMDIEPQVSPLNIAIFVAVSRVHGQQQPVLIRAPFLPPVCALILGRR